MMSQYLLDGVAVNIIGIDLFYQICEEFIMQVSMNVYIMSVSVQVVPYMNLLTVWMRTYSRGSSSVIDFPRC